VFSNLTEETRPLSLKREGLDPKAIEREREILVAAAQADPKNAKKPPEILEKIIEGQVNKFIASRVLLEQPYARDPKLSVGEFVKSSGAGVTVEGFAYVSTDQD
jgi:elongation factor Ts